MATSGAVAPDRCQLDLRGAVIRGIDLRGANQERASFSGADCPGALVRGANFKETILMGAILRGADRTDARNLTWQQLDEAIIDGTTILPAYLIHERTRASV